MADDTGEEREVRPIVLGFFDVLGFSDRLERDGLREVARTYDELIGRAIEVGPMPGLGLRWISENEGVPILFALQDQHAYFSTSGTTSPPLEIVHHKPY